MLGLFGALPFTVSDGLVMTFSGFSRSLGQRFEQHKAIGCRPVLEWTGSEAAKISFSMRFDSSLGVPPQTGMRILSEMLDSHESWPLVIGTEYYGRFALESVEEERSHFDGFGFGLDGTARVSLVEDAG